MTATYSDTIKATQMTTTDANNINVALIKPMYDTLFKLCGIMGCMVDSEEEIESRYGAETVKNWCVAAIERWESASNDQWTNSGSVVAVCSRAKELFAAKYPAI